MSIYPYRRVKSEEDLKIGEIYWAYDKSAKWFPVIYKTCPDSGNRLCLLNGCWTFKWDELQNVLMLNAPDLAAVDAGTYEGVEDVIQDLSDALAECGKACDAYEIPQYDAGGYSLTPSYRVRTLGGMLRDALSDVKRYKAMVDKLLQIGGNDHYDDDVDF